MIYESSVRRLDRENVEPIVTALDRARLADSTLLLFTADHGEELYDHGGYGHGMTVHEEVLHVPLVVRFPRGARPAGLPAEVTEPTSTADLHSSLVAFAGLAPTAGLAPANLFQGRGRSFAFAESRQHWAVVRGGLKFVHGKKKDRLFDLRTDPNEKVDLAEERADDAATLRELGENLLASTPHGAAPVIDATLDPQAIRDLTQLGYIK